MGIFHDYPSQAVPKPGKVKKRSKHMSKNLVREMVIERDGNWCLICGKPSKGLHLHRIMYGAQGGRYEPDNCVQLCVVHHELVHSNKRYWQPLLMGYVRKARETRVSFADFQ